MNKPRCKDCGHPRGPRAVTATSKRKGNVPAEPRVHKKPCHCVCHRPSEAS